MHKIEKLTTGMNSGCLKTYGNNFLAKNMKFFFAAEPSLNADLMQILNLQIKSVLQKLLSNEDAGNEEALITIGFNFLPEPITFF